MSGRIVSLNRSNGGVPKLQVDDVLVTVDGIQGDHQRDRRHHGGPDRAVSIYSVELIEHLESEGHPIAPGTVGENVTVRGVDWREVIPGRRLLLGDVELEVTAFAFPCTTIRRSFLDEDFTRISQKVHPGWSRVYARVIRAGMIRRGDEVKLVPETATA